VRIENDMLITETGCENMSWDLPRDPEDVEKCMAGEDWRKKEEPKEEKSAPLERVKVRASSDNSVGWITDRGGNVKPWRSSYKFSKASKLYASKGSKESVVREVKDGEVLELVEVPVEVEGKMWMKGRLKREGAVGWATMKDEEGEKLLVNM
jgi:hypothetical protein